MARGRISLSLSILRMMSAQRPYEPVNVALAKVWKCRSISTGCYGAIEVGDQLRSRYWIYGGRPMGFELDYSKMIILDAEDLAEGGIQAAYKELLPALLEYVKDARGSGSRCCRCSLPPGAFRAWPAS
jgi:hypothetical protein